MNLQQFKQFDVNRLDMEELVLLAALGRQIRAEYEALGLDEPDWVDIQLKTIKREIHVRSADKLEKRRREIDQRLEGLKTPTQKKAELLREKAQIDKQLAEVG